MRLDHEVPDPVGDGLKLHAITVGELSGPAHVLEVVEPEQVHGR
jgi:hypothetical protein